MARARRVDRGGRKVLVGPPAGSVRSASREVVPTGTELRRVYWPAPHKTTSTGFRHNGPRARFDHHRRPGRWPAAADDPDRGIFYCAPAFDCCVQECFGDEYLIDPAGAYLAVLEVVDDLVLLDLRGRGAVAAGTLAAINDDGDRELTQDWARWWYEQPELQDVHGMVFAGAHTGADAMAIFERAAGRFAATFDAPLDGPEVFGELLVVADEFDMALTITAPGPP